MAVEIKLSEKGRSWRSLRTQMTKLCTDDLDWRNGRHSAYVWHAGEEVKKVAQKAYTMFITENGLGMRVFPSLREMHGQVVGMTGHILDGEGCAGQMTSGGTESIFLATKAARDWARVKYPRIQEPEIVAPYSAHPAINKAAHYLNMKVVRIPTGSDFRADVAAMSRAINRNTIMAYGSAPSFSMGVIDSIPDLGAVAKEKGLWLHVDACVGGILGPFVRRLGYPVPPFGLDIPGVSSISADLHKSGYTAKGASTVLFRDQELQSSARFDFDDWPSGLYSSQTFTGTNPGGAIAAAWAVMNFLGAEGYLNIAETVMRMRATFVKELTKIEGVHIWGQPDLWAVAYGSRNYDMLNVAKKMWAGGWGVAPILNPPGIHFMITPVHEPFIDEYLSALKESIDQVRKSVSDMDEITVRYT